jgi:hypothetical protein
VRIRNIKGRGESDSSAYYLINVDMTVCGNVKSMYAMKYFLLEWKSRISAFSLVKQGIYAMLQLICKKKKKKSA